MSDKKKRYTSQQIADMLGVSRGTVYRALNNTGRIKEETKNKILALAKEVNYKPNRLARALVLNQTVRIAVIIPRYPEFYYRQIEAGMAQAAQRVNEDLGTEVELLCYRTGFANDGLKQIEVLETLNSLPEDKKNYDGIIIIPGATNILKSELDKAVEFDIPVVLIGGDVPGSARLCFVGENFVSAGRTAGELMCKFSKGAGSIAVLQGYSNASNLTEREKGFTGIIERDYPYGKLLSPISYFEDPVKAYNITKRLIHDYKDLKGIFITSASGLSGAGKAVFESGKAEKINLIGFEYSPEIEGLLQNGSVTAAISTRPEVQGRCAVQVLAKYLTEGEKPSSDVLHTRFNILLKETDNSGRYEAEEW